MNVLFVYSGNRSAMPFVHEQRESLRPLVGQVDEFKIVGRGVWGYLRSVVLLWRLVRASHYDVIHAHYGLAGLLAVLQRRVPVVITFHGSDVNLGMNRWLSWAASRLAAFNVFVNKAMWVSLGRPPRSVVIPCGVDLKVFEAMDTQAARRQLGFSDGVRYVLFTSAFDNPVKNYALARAAVNLLGDGVELVELKGVSRGGVNLLLNASDLLLMTSHSEGSPQVIKEAMACNCPIVSVDVGDVAELISGVVGCHVVGHSAQQLAMKMRKVLDAGERSEGRKAVEHLGLDAVAARIFETYKLAVSR